MNIFIPLWVLLIPLILIGITFLSLLFYIAFYGCIQALDMYCRAKGIYQLFTKFIIENRPKKKGRVIMK